MSVESKETVADIVAEMRGPYYKMGRSNASLDKDMMGYMSLMANRIEAAYKDKVECLNGDIIGRDHYIAELTKKNARLEAVLKPVLEAKREDCDCGSEWAIMCMNRVNEAQRIYKENRDGDVK